MTRVLGIIGGGQLGMMLTEAAKKMPEHISDIIVLDPNKNCPAAKVGAKQIIADFSDKQAIVELSLQTDIITYEIESGNADVLQSIKNTIPINPDPETLRIIQDKFLQKKFLLENNIPVTDFDSVTSISDMEDKITSFGYPVMLKLRRDAYDGRGNYLIKSHDKIKEGYDKFAGKPIMIEKNVDFIKEVSVIASRNTKGEIAIYPTVENIHEENILRMTIAPARISKHASEEAEEIAKKVMELFHGAGVFGIEMFVTKDDRVLINEIAPRVHNSGHHTIQSSQTSQFEQHLKAILGIELGKTDLSHYAVMCNILGPKDQIGKCTSVSMAQMEGVYLKWYQKDEVKPLRKMGHFNVIDTQDTRNVEGLISKAEEIQRSIKFIIET